MSNILDKDIRGDNLTAAMKSIVEQAEKRGGKKKKASQKDKKLEKMLKTRKNKIKVVGIGGAGNNTISRMSQIGIVGGEIVAVNTDAQDLLYTEADEKLLIGKEVTQGLGAGAEPAIGEEAAKESKKDIAKMLGDSNMVFVTCGLGGGTGTGGAPIIAEAAKKMGKLTVGIATLPFSMEGKQRSSNARTGLERLESVVDTLIIIPNDKLLEIVPEVSLTTAFKVADEILVNAVKGITELVTKPGLVNLDFADIKAVMGEGGLAMIGMAESDTENRALEAVQKAITNPLLDVDIDGAKGALINVTGGPDTTMKEAHQIVDAVNQQLSEEAKVIWGSQIEKNLGDKLKVLLIVTGVKSSQIFGPGKSYAEERQKEMEKILGIDFVEE